MTAPLRAMIVGGWPEAGLRASGLPLAAIEDGLPATAERRTSPDLASALNDSMHEGWFPDLAIVVQQYPEQFPSRDVARALGEWSLARWVVCLGAWCESAMRTGIAWPPAVCVPARGCCERIAAELSVVNGNRAPLPLTASRDEIFAFDAMPPAAAASAGVSVAVRSPDRALAEFVAELAVRCGCRATLSVGKSDPPSDLVLWDVDPWCAEIPSRIGNVLAANPRTAVMALMGLAHPEDVAALRTAGVRDVVPKLSIASVLPALLRQSTAARF